MNETHAPQPTIDVDRAFNERRNDPDFRQGDAEWASYLDTRPTKDAEGIIHEPGGATFDEAYADDYFAQQYKVADERHNDQTAYEDMQPSQLAKKLAQAEFHGDKTSEQNIEDVLHGKLDDLDAKYFSERDDGSTANTRPHTDDGVNHNTLRSERLEDRVNKIRDRELDALEKASGQPSKVPNEEARTHDTPDRAVADPSEAVTEVLPVTGEPGTSVTEIKPNGFEQPEAPESSEERAEQSHWQRFKRGVRKHLYEAPMDMGAMGPITQPEVPFDQWYEEKLQQESGRLSQAVDQVAGKAFEKIAGMAETGAEHVGNMTDQMRYAGSMALADVEYHAGNAADYTRDNALEIKDDVALRAAIAAEFAAESGRKAKRIGSLVLHRIASIPEALRARQAIQSEEEAARTQNADRLNPDIVSRKHNWDWDSDWDWDD